MHSSVVAHVALAHNLAARRAHDFLSPQLLHPLIYAVVVVRLDLIHGHSVLTERAFYKGILGADILFLKHACSVLRQSSNPVCGSWKSQAS